MSKEISVKELGEFVKGMPGYSRLLKLTEKEIYEKIISEFFEIQKGNLTIDSEDLTNYWESEPSIENVSKYLSGELGVGKDKVKGCIYELNNCGALNISESLDRPDYVGLGIAGLAYMKDEV